MILPVQLMISAVKISDGEPLTRWMRIVLPFMVLRFIEFIQRTVCLCSQVEDRQARSVRPRLEATANLPLLLSKIKQPSHAK
jgi:hypothetical protein